MYTNYPSKSDFCEELSCKSMTYEYADVSVPMNIVPHVCVGALKTVCCGEPIVSCQAKHPCNGEGPCCNIVITQTLRIEIPIEYSACADVDAPQYVCRPLV